MKLGTPPQPVDPYPLYESLRKINRVYESTTLGAFAITGYKEVSAAAKMPSMRNGTRGFTKRREDWEQHDALRLLLRAMVTLDPPEHTRIRDFAASLFSPALIKQMRASIERLADRHLDDLADKASGGTVVDLVKTVASPFPVSVISEILGVPDEQGMMFYDLANDWTRVWGGGGYSEEELARADVAVMELRGHFEEIFKERRKKPQDDLISTLLKATDDGQLSDEDLMALSTFLFISGFETTTNLISMGLYTLLENRDQLALWRNKPEITPGAVEELLRHGTPIAGTIRLTSETIQLGDKTIPDGRLIFLMTAGANRDPAQFTDPDRLDLTRSEGPHVSFGGGAHYCLGANLARMEAQVILPKMINRFSEIDVAGVTERRTATGLQGFEYLPLQVKE
ncbi:cytochrome P450 [Streptomyces sp. NPDC050659]